MSPPKKQPGEGTVSKLRNGRWWARGPLQANGRRPSFGTFATEEEARTVLDRALWMLETGKTRAGSPFFVDYANNVLDLREEDGVRGIKQERSRFRLHLSTSSLAGIRIADVTHVHVGELVRALTRKRAADKRGERKISRKTVQRCLVFVSAVCNEAMTAGLVTRNPCVGVRVKKSATEATKETWAYFTPEEQAAVIKCDHIPRADRLIVAFALGTGIRQGELIHGKLDDLHVTGDNPHFLVRFGSKDKAPKSGKTRRVPLFGLALEAATAWLALLPKFAPHNPDRLIFPTALGFRRQAGKVLGNGRWRGGHKEGRRIMGAKWQDLWHGYQIAAGIVRPIRWHDLRHTCASSLIAGWWGRKWTLEEVKELLGHSSIMVTQIYAHLGETSLKLAGRETAGVGYALVTGGGLGASGVAAITSDINEARPARVELATNALGNPSGNEGLRLLEVDAPPSNEAPVTNEASTARRLLEALQAGNVPEALSLAVTLATGRLEATARTEEDDQATLAGNGR